MRMVPTVVSSTTTGPVAAGRGGGVASGVAWARKKASGTRAAIMERPPCSIGQGRIVAAPRLLGSPPGRRMKFHPMVLFNYSTKELTAKVVYYGPGLCGKTTNLQWIHEKLPIRNKGKMLSLATETDRTLFFDFLPIEIGTIRGMRTRIQLYTVPGQVFYNATRRMVLKGADCVIFVCDSRGHDRPQRRELREHAGEPQGQRDRRRRD